MEDFSNIYELFFTELWTIYDILFFHLFHCYNVGSFAKKHGAKHVLNKS